MPIFPKNTSEFKMISPLLSKRKKKKAIEKARIAEFKAKVESGMTKKEAINSQTTTIDTVIPEKNN